MSKPTTTEANPLLVPGEQFHWCGRQAMTARTTLTGLGNGVVLQRGMTVVLTAAFIEANEGWIRLLGDEEGQRDRWNGEVRFRPGAWPEGMLKTVRGDRDHEEDREVLRLRAHTIEDPTARALALADVVRLYGPSPTSKEIASYRGGSGR